MFKIGSIFFISFFAIACLNSCSCTKKASAAPRTENQKANQKFYLMLRLIQEGNGVSVRIGNIEKEVFTDPNNPLPLPPSEESGETFRCEVLDKNNKLITTHEVKSEFKYGTPDSKPEAIVKFIFRIDGDAHSARVSRKLRDGVWEEILTTRIENEKKEGSKK